jgi:protein-S-isoprenylcysteine O-methyltransferase Ste14
MTRCGIGPRFSLVTVACGIVTGWISFQYPTVFKMSGIASWFLVAPGCVLVVTGTTVYIMALRIFNEAYRHKRLATHGPYAFIRHPIYFAWIVLICPGVILFFQSWLMLLLPLVAYLSFKASIHQEDRDLEDQFGQAYQDYRRSTRELFPVLFSGYTRVKDGSEPVP